MPLGDDASRQVVADRRLRASDERHIAGLHLRDDTIDRCTRSLQRRHFGGVLAHTEIVHDNRAAHVPSGAISGGRRPLREQFDEEACPHRVAHCSNARLGHERSHDRDRVVGFTPWPQCEHTRLRRDARSLEARNDQRGLTLAGHHQHRETLERHGLVTGEIRKVGTDGDEQDIDTLTLHHDAGPAESIGVHRCAVHSSILAARQQNLRDEHRAGKQVYAGLVRARVFPLIGLIAMVSAGCTAVDIGVTATRSVQSETAGGNPGIIDNPDDPNDPTGTDDRDYEVIDGVVDFGEAGPQHPEYDGYLTAAFLDIQEYWAATFPEVYGSPYEPLAGGIYAAYPDREAPIPGCGTTNSTYEDVAAGTAFYCSDGDFMAYDDHAGLPELVDLLGRPAVAVVLAHEFGHAIQARSGDWNQPIVLKEQQADCFAGAWSAHVASGQSDNIRFDDDAVRAGMIAMVYVRDPVEAGGLNNPQAHGTGFDRVGAFQDGYEGGAERCSTFFTENRLEQLIDIPFDFTDVNGGNLPLYDVNPDPTTGPADIITLIPGSLERYWVALMTDADIAFTPPSFEAYSSGGPYPSCPDVDEGRYPSNVIYCPDTNTIYWDEDFAYSLSRDPYTGDMSVGYLFSNAYSSAVQYALESELEGESRALFDECLTGSWVGSIIPPLPDDADLFLSAGDLDEAVITAISRSDESSDTNISGDAFEKVSAFRTGVLGGLDGCGAMFDD